MLDLSLPKRIHIVGICGAGMSSIAVVLQQMGHTLSGSDLADNEVAEKLRDSGIKLYQEHQSENISAEIDFVAYSSAINEANPELLEAKNEKIPLLRRAEILAAICQLKKTIAVAGSHGKTTTAAMLATAMKSKGVSYLIGGEFMDGSLGGYWDEKGEWLVVEADESDGTFLELPVELALLTSMDSDHIEHYKSVENLDKAYSDFVTQAKATVLQMDESKIQQLGEKLNPSDYISVCSEETEILSPNFRFQKNDSTATTAVIQHTDSKNKQKNYKLKIPTPGRHNLSNATMALAASIYAGVKPKPALTELKTFSGIKRRFEIWGEVNGVMFIDDYAHTPKEISETLNVLKDWNRRIVCAFQPHRYSRTETLWENYADAFNNVDILTISEIYSAGEAKREGISAKLILDAVLNQSPRKQVAWLPEKTDLLDYFKVKLHPGDVFLTLSAGDLNQVSAQIYQTMKNGKS